MAATMSTTMESENANLAMQTQEEVKSDIPQTEGAPAQNGETTSASNIELAEAKRDSSPDLSEGSAAEKAPITAPKSNKQKKREDKSIEHVLKALNSLQTSEEKLAALCKKYTELLEDHRVLQAKFKKSQKSLTVIVREKDQLQSEHSKAMLAKSKLESLCRELQRHNKLVKEESLARAREEEEKRKEVTNKFQSTINDIQGQMNEHYNKNAKLREENMELANKLKSLIEQYEVREKHIEQVFKHKELEQKLVDAKLQQSQLMHTEEKEKNSKEKHILLAESLESRKKIELLEAQEVQLRAQVGLYTEKYEEFQTTLGKSNEVFQSFKTEMEKMTKKIKKLEKETNMWRSRWENSNRALLEMAEDKTKSDAQKQQMQIKIGKLENLCRALQAERKTKSPEPETNGADSSSNAKPNNSAPEQKTEPPDSKTTAKSAENEPKQSVNIQPDPPKEQSEENLSKPTETAEDKQDEAKLEDNKKTEQGDESISSVEQVD